MKLLKTDTPYLTTNQWKKIFLAMSILTTIMYVIAMIFSLSGSNYFILNYQNEQMDKIEKWFLERDISALITFVYMTIESCIILAFTLNKKIKWYHPLAFYLINVGLALIIKDSFQMAFTITQIVLSVIFIFIDRGDYKNKIIRFLIATAISLVYQFMITIIKSGSFDGSNHVLTFSGHFIYAIEYDIALSVVLFTISLYIYREKGDSKTWDTDQVHGGSSQTSMKHSQKSLRKNLTKTQKNKIRLYIFKMYLIQLGTFILVMMLPFMLGKVFEFLVMYFSFCLVRYILGFKYSLHFKKESVCSAVGVLVFGIITLAVPFFNVAVIVAIAYGIALAILLHLSYKYESFYIFNKISKPDKFAELYVLMNEDIRVNHVRAICIYYDIDRESTDILSCFAEGNKKSYIAKKFNYSEKTIERKINETLTLLNSRM